MAMFDDNPERPEQYRRFEHATPTWFRDAKLGIFVHWGPYSVPAWAEPDGQAAMADLTQIFSHMPYAEWYLNTIRIPGSPAAERHREVHGDAPYDDFLDQWKAENFDAKELLALVASTGAGYFVPTAKHHDGVTLWDAPATGDRNTVKRGPQRDLVGELCDAARGADVRFGVYYSGGLDWHFHDAPPLVGLDDLGTGRPVDPAYAEYAFDQVLDLIHRYQPDVLWGDIDWPDAGKPEGPHSLVRLLEEFYATAPDGVVNDRWGQTHWDFRTSEYQLGGNVEGNGMWENTRGIGHSFGYNQCEQEDASLGGEEAIRHFLDVVSRGGNLLLNIGLRADGTVPPRQRQTLTELAAWNSLNGSSVFGSRPVSLEVAQPSETPWVRWTETAGQAHAFIATTETRVTLQVSTGHVVTATARLADGTACPTEVMGSAVVITLPSDPPPGPVQVTFELTGAR